MVALGPGTLRGAFKCHGTLPMRQGRTQTAPKVNYARTCKHEPPVLTPTYTSVPFSAAYYQFPVFYTSNVAPNKDDMEMYIQHTRVKHFNTENCLKTTPRITRTRYAFVKHTEQTIGTIIRPIYFSFDVPVY